MTIPVVVVGAGGFGRETIDIVEALNRENGDDALKLLGVLDDGPASVNLERLAARNVPYLGGIASWIDSGEQAQYLLAVSGPAVRRKLVSYFDDAGCMSAGVVHPDAVIGSCDVIGRGAIICAGARVTTNVTLGAFVHLNLNTVVGHDTVLGDYVTVNPTAVICGDCTVGDEVMVGAASVILQGVRVGRKAIVGACACVVRDVGSATVVKGVPAR